MKIDAQVSMDVKVTGQSLRYPLLPFCWETGQLGSCCPQNETRKQLENEERELLAACACFHDWRGEKLTSSGPLILAAT